MKKKRSISLPRNIINNGAEITERKHLQIIDIIMIINIDENNLLRKLFDVHFNQLEFKPIDDNCEHTTGKERYPFLKLIIYYDTFILNQSRCTNRPVMLNSIERKTNIESTYTTSIHLNTFLTVIIYTWKYNFIELIVIH